MSEEEDEEWRPSGELTLAPAVLVALEAHLTPENVCAGVAGQPPHGRETQRRACARAIGSVFAGLPSK